MFLVKINIINNNKLMMVFILFKDNITGMEDFLLRLSEKGERCFL